MSHGRKPSGNSFNRVIFVAIAVAVQAGWILLKIVEWNAYSQWFSMAFRLLSVVVVLKLYSSHTNAAMKMSWMILILVMPVMGMSLYLMCELLGASVIRKRLSASRRNLQNNLSQGMQTLNRLELWDASAGNQSRYLWYNTHWPVYENTKVDYFGQCKDVLDAMKADLERAEHFIFMEYFIVEDKSSFREIEEILVRKARQGVDVRFMYDDIGSMGYVNMAFAKRLNQEGIQCHAFNPAMPLLNIFLNNRDHRKITVVDGKVGYTGGYNLADAYFDRAHPYGEWKDTGLRLEGEAVKSLTTAFFELWNLRYKSWEDVSKFLKVVHTVPSEGFVQPYDDNPLGRDRVAEDVYLNLISQATKSVYFVTPYLIITDELSRALGLAAKRGVDVRVITPGIPDKKIIYAVTRSYYAGLARQGVRIFEYTPGFCHAKIGIADGKAVSIGTSNLDYRSLYHHFENNVFLYGCKAVEDIASDIDGMFPRCREVTEHYRTGRGAFLRLWQCILRLFAPLM